ncbi:glycine zipper domain-containing protein [Pontibacter sp. E15-1]|uniref:glycine zipper domain-containing protein n=1 Tax=Pontibacter sp. E15-1 TaxID=2919918 RepID=UPI001F4FFF9D|nr:glycine zipper domain-containing protein [Pontibacter sp. E15-1]MCJ8165021.1 glycine zipper domain-containing protein [Pontibacter sp. E15-1]
MKKLPYILSIAFLLAFVWGSAAQAQQKKWSPQAKGTVIGAATGAAAGAVIHKRNRVVGGVVGGAVGGGTGYAIGKHIDNKNKQREADRIAEANRVAAANRAAAAQAQRQRSVATSSHTHEPKSTRNAVTPTQMAAMPYQSYTAVNDPVLVNMALLPNESYGDPSTPYYTSEYRRKSW